MKALRLSAASLYALMLMVGIVVSLPLVISATTMKHASTPPDFAYPKQVSTNALRDLQKALRDGNDPLAIRSLMDYALAQASIDPDSLPEALSRIEQVKSASTAPVQRSLLSLLQAKIYLDLYLNNRWNFDERQLPLEPLPADYTEWSGAQMKEVITRLCSEALADTKALKATSIAAYASVIALDAADRVYYPTLFDFVATNVGSVLESLCNESVGFIPLDRLQADRIGQPFVSMIAPLADQIMALYDERVDFHALDAPLETAPYLQASLDRLQWVAANLATVPNELRDSTVWAAYQQLYSSRSDSEYSANVLIAMGQLPLDLDSDDSAVEERIAWLYANATTDAKRFAAFNRQPCLLNLVARFSQKQVAVRSPQLFAPGEPRKASVRLTNVDRATLTLYRLAPTDLSILQSDFTLNPGASLPVVATYTVESSRAVPFSESQDVEVTIPEVGSYILVPSFEGQTVEKRGKSFPVISCSSLALGFVSFATMSEAVVVEPISGAPRAAVDIYHYDRNNSRWISERLGKTGSAGFMQLPKGVGGHFRPVQGADIAALTDYHYSSSRGYSDDASLHLQGFTSLGIYHPGDSVEWAAVLYESTLKSHKAVGAGVKATALLRDANDEEIDTLEVMTDQWGRVVGTFDIPSDRLTGRYSVAIKTEKEYVGSFSFMVSDYKMPTFYVKVDSVERDVPSRGAVTLKGLVSTYADFPLPDSRVLLVLKVSGPWRWFFTPETLVCIDTVTTDAHGRFTFELDASMLASSPYPDGFYEADITATSPTAESQTTHRFFTLGRPYTIQARFTSNDINAAEPFAFPLTVTDANDTDVDCQVEYKWIDAQGAVVAQGQASSLDPKASLEDIPSGIYSLRLSLADGKAEPVTINDLALYRLTDSLPPRPAPYWLPSSRVSTTDGRGSLVIGTTAPEVNILCSWWTTDSLLSQHWISLTPGIYTLPIEAPKVHGAVPDELTLTLQCTNQWRNLTDDITVVNRRSQRAIKIVSSSMRSRVNPGDEETWTFQITAADGSPASAAVILDLYNQALNALQSNDYGFYIYSPRHPHLDTSTPNLGQSCWSRVSKDEKWLLCPSLSVPAFELYGQEFVPYILRDMLFNVMPASAGARRFKGMASNMVMAEECAVVEDDADLGAASMAEEPEESESSVEANEQFDYRDSNVPLAAFLPSLTTDADGRLTVTLRIPNANTTWQLNMLAYTPDLEVATMLSDIIARKPVMVTPNLPRFMRYGDRLDIKASVANATDSLLTVTTTVEIFDPLSGRVIDSKATVSEIEGGAVDVVTYTLDAPTIGAAIGYRVRSVAANGFSDGEQAIIPLQPATTPVIESTPFCLGRTVEELSIQLPEMPYDGRVTLQACENPMWYVITALPSISTFEYATATDLGMTLSAIGICKGILAQHPQVGDAIREWASSAKTDSVLVSMLERNQDLKLLLLQATPWMQDAKDDTQRMQQLTLLLDPKEISRRYDRALSLLQKLQQEDGGLAWMAQYHESSLWPTNFFLCALGIVRELGYYDQLSSPELDALIDKAITYSCRETEKVYKRYPDALYTMLASVVRLWPNHAYSTTTRSIVAATLQQVIKDWRSMDLYEKSMMVPLLKDAGFEAAAGQILESIQEFAVSTPEKGMWWPSVEGQSMVSQLGLSANMLMAYKAMLPARPALEADIDDVRQWVVMQKQTQDWGDFGVNYRLIGGMVSTGSDWLTADKGLEVKLNGHKLSLPRASHLVGEFTMSLDAKQASGARLQVKRSGNQPAWGAVMCQYVDDIAHVQADSIPQLSIRKRLLVERGGEWVVITDSLPLQLGERVKTELTIHCDQTMDYVVIADQRASALEPVEQLPEPVYSQGICFYRENKDMATQMFVSRLPVGTYIITYDSWANNAGRVASGIASIQSQYAPAMTAHSSGTLLTILP